MPQSMHGQGFCGDDLWMDLIVNCCLPCLLPCQWVPLGLSSDVTGVFGSCDLCLVWPPSGGDVSCDDVRESGLGLKFSGTNNNLWRMKVGCNFTRELAHWYKQSSQVVRP